MSVRSYSAVAALLVVALQGGCALLSKADARLPRYFSPEQAPGLRLGAQAQQLELRLGRVSSASHLDERIAYRLGASEVGFYDELRWTEIPEAYLRRALERELFEQRGVQRVVSGAAPTLDVELTAFEEVRGSPTQARVALSFSLQGDRRSLLDRSMVLERPVPDHADADAAQRLTAALSSALAEAVASLSDAVVEELRAAQLAAEPRPDPTPEGDATGGQ